MPSGKRCPFVPKERARDRTMSVLRRLSNQELLHDGPNKLSQSEYDRCFFQEGKRWTSSEVSLAHISHARHLLSLITPQEAYLVRRYTAGEKHCQIGYSLGRSDQACRLRVRKLRAKGTLVVRACSPPLFTRGSIDAILNHP
jgi:hypothetical protein